MGDTGTVSTPTGRLEVADTRHALQGFHGHRAKVIDGYVQTGQEADLQIDTPRRERIRKSHTGTHVLHWALRRVLGEHARQAGSLVTAGRLRFDFNHFSAPSEEDLAEVEAEANRRLIENTPVKTEVTTKDEAEEMGALAFFGDKYGDVVRVVRIGEYSVELCGGTHTTTSAEVGPLIVVSESSIGSNLRRVEALTGEAAYEHIVAARHALDQAGRLLRVAGPQVPGRVEQLMDRVAELEHSIQRMQDAHRAQVANELAGEAEQIGEVHMVVHAVDNLAADELRRLAVEVRERIGRGVVILGSAAGGKGALVGTVTRDLVELGLSAADLISGPARKLGGGGSRDPELAQAGGPRGDELGGAIELAREEAGRALAGV